MDRIEITDEEKKSLINIDGYKYYGASYCFDGTVKPIGDDVTDLFKAFILSKDNTRLSNEGKYRVILDNKTGFKHYFIDKEEDFVMFYLKNGEDATQYSKRNEIIYGFDYKKLKREKFFKVGNSIIRTGIKSFLKMVLYVTILTSSVLMVNAAKEIGLKDFTIEKGISYYFEIRQDLTVDDLISRINSSTMLTNSQKGLLANRKYLSAITPYINKTDASKIAIRRKFDDITIKYVDATGEPYAGYYNSLDCGIYISDKYAPNGSEPDFFPSVAFHEFAHLCQHDCYYNVISEAMAELSKEFDDNTVIYAYPEQRYITTKLMEIIGRDPVLEYTLTDNINVISNEIKPYLSDSELKEFLRCLSFDPFNNDVALQKMNICDSLLNKVYLNKFGISVEEDPVIPYLKDESLVRYYVNKDKANRVGSYVTVVSIETKTVTMKLDKALEKYPIMVYLQDKGGAMWGESLLDYLNNRGRGLGEFYGYSWSDEYKVKEVYQKNGEWYVVVDETKTIDNQIKNLPNLEEKFKMLEESKANRSL